MLQVNLLPDVKKEFIKAQHQRNLVMTVCFLSGGVAIGIVVVLGLIMGGQQLQKGILLGNIDRDKATIQKNQDEKQLNEYLTIQNQLSQLDNLKESQAIYSRLFDFLRQLNPAEPNNIELNSVRMTSSSGEGGSIELRGTTANFASLDVFKTTLTFATITYTDVKGEYGKPGDSVTIPLFTAVVVSQAGLAQVGDGSRVSFAITVTYDAAAFDRNNFDKNGPDDEDNADENNRNVTLKIPSKTTSDADRNAPQNVFNTIESPETPGDDSPNNSNYNSNSGGN